MNHMFYFFLALTAVTAATADTYKAVFDMDGYPMLDGINYHVLSLSNVPIYASGLTLAPRGDNQCPLYIGQGQDFDTGKGIPVKFSNWRHEGFVPESENLNIEMGIADSRCVQSTYWWVTDVGSSTSLIAVGPKPGQGEDSSKSFFQIKRVSEDDLDSYKIASCPNDSDCIYVGAIVDENGLRRLALSSRPSLFVFKRARDQSATSSKTI